MRKRKGIFEKCLTCGIDFYVYPHLIGKSKYCGRTCSAKGTRNHKGHTHSKESRIKMSISHKEYCKTNGSAFKGRVHGEEALSKMRGRKLTEYHRKKLSLAKVGKYGILSNGWIKDRTKLKPKEDRRGDAAYHRWRKDVWHRDNYRCVMGNKDCKGRLEAHHILSWREFPELRYITTNGITLCHHHHPRKWSEERAMVMVFNELLVSKNN